MPTIEFRDKTFLVDEDGFLQDFNDWCPEWVEYIQTTQGIVLTDEHWKLINVLQNYYRKNNVAPMVRMLSKTTGFKMKQIFELFPAGPGKGACKMARASQAHGLRIACWERSRFA